MIVGFIAKGGIACVGGLLATMAPDVASARRLARANRVGFITAWRAVTAISRLT